jgi:hypothetical protein
MLTTLEAMLRSLRSSGSMAAVREIVLCLQGRVVFAERKLAGPAVPSVADALALAPARRRSPFNSSTYFA